MARCPCGRYDIEEKAKICPYCGELLLQPMATRALEDGDIEEVVPRWGTARFNSRMNLILSLRDSNMSYVFDANEVTELIIGRADPLSGEYPPVDLTEFGAVEKGVSRRHAAIIRKDGGALHIVDKGTPNGTYLNGQRLIAHQPRILRDGDELRVGRLVMSVHFERNP